MNTIWQDLGFGARMLWKPRLATIVSLIALALGIDTNTARFSLAEAFLLHPVPFEHSDTIAALVDSQPQQNMETSKAALPEVKGTGPGRRAPRLN
jgi:hypothetical protein